MQVICEGNSYRGWGLGWGFTTVVKNSRHVGRVLGAKIS